jgi:prepilin peptidase CpaA
LTFPAIIWGILSYMVMQGLEGLWFSFLGLFVGLAIFFIPFAMGGMGGGDIKMLGAVGALQGWKFVFSAAVMAAIAGGVIAIIYLILTGRLLNILKKMTNVILAPLFSLLYHHIRWEFLNRASIYFARTDPKEKEPVRLPYGVAIATGAMIVMVIDLFQWGETLFSGLPR